MLTLICLMNGIIGNMVTIATKKLILFAETTPLTKSDLFAKTVPIAKRNVNAIIHIITPVKLNVCSLACLQMTNRCNIFIIQVSQVNTRPSVQIPAYQSRNNV